MIYKKTRKDLLSCHSAFDLKKPQLQESQLIELISRMIKNIKKKQNLYNRMVFQTLRKKRQTLDQDNSMISQFHQLIAQMKQLEHSLKKFKNASFYASKNYLYTVLMRTTEIIQISKQKCLAQGKKDAQSVFQSIKQQIKQIYLNQTYQEKYQSMHIFQFINKNQQTRMNAYIKRTLLEPLQIKKQKLFLQKIKENPFEGLKKTHSIQLFKKKQFIIDEIISKKINFELATQKRMKERNHFKIRKNLFKVYDILQLKVLYLQHMNAQNQQTATVQRNLRIKQSIKKWEKKYAIYKTGKFNK